MYAFIALLHIAAVVLAFAAPWDYGFFVAAIVSSAGWFAIFLIMTATPYNILSDGHYFVANYTQVFAALVGFSALFWLRTIGDAPGAAIPFLACGTVVLGVVYYYMMKLSFIIRQYQ
jgi:hypothetical protein